MYVNMLGKTLDIKHWLSHLHILHCFKSFPSPFILIFLTLGHHSPFVKITRQEGFYKGLCDSVLVSGHLFAVVLSSTEMIELLHHCMHGSLVENKYLLFKFYEFVFIF